MSIVLTDPQLKSASLAVVNAPDEIAALNQQKLKVLASKTSALNDDNTNKIFYDNEHNIINRYHKELEYLNGTVHTAYADTDLDNAGKLLDGNIHFPTSPAWVYLNPKLHTSNNGNPTSTLPASTTEPYKIDEVQARIANIKTGYADGANSGQVVFGGYSGGTTLNSTVSFPTGNRLLVRSATEYAFVQVVSSTPVVGVLPYPPTYYQLTVTVICAATGTIIAGSTITDFYSGWTDAQRKETVTVPYVNVLHYFEGLLDTAVNTLEAHLNLELTELNANDATGTEATEITTSKNSVQAMLTEISTWEGKPATGTNGRYGDTNIGFVEAQLTSRETLIPTRITQITTALGNVTQAGDGSFSGSGHYHSFFKWVDLRVNKAYGTLRIYYNFDLILDFMDKKIQGVNNRLTEYSVYMVAQKLTADTDGTNIIKVISTTGLNISDVVKILDDSATPILDTTITAITGLNVTLANNVSGFTTAKVARILKLL